LGVNHRAGDASHSGKCHADTPLSEPTYTIILTKSTVLTLFAFKQIYNIRCLK